MSDQGKMDEDFAYFYETKGFGPAISSQEVSPEKIAKFRDKLPNQLLAYWQEYGFSGYGKGLFWIVDPDEWEPTLEAWIGDTPFMERDAYYVVARSAFGQLYLWGTKSGPGLDVKALRGMIFPGDKAKWIAEGKGDSLVRSFFAFRQSKDLDQMDHLGKPLFERALKTLGPLAADEMYGFEPALALGGKPELKNLRKFKAVEHLVMLAQLGERKVMRDIVKDAEATGLIPPR